jgi:hypothetical protein
MIPLFIGYDPVESVAFHTLCHSIISRSTVPVSITPIGNTVLPKGFWWRERGRYDSTEFSNARFVVPYLMNYSGWAIFMDCDMIMLDDIEELWAQRDDRYSVMVVKHCHVPREDKKFLGAIQTRYPLKNWSSLMMFNTSHPHCRSLTRSYINTVSGLDLHEFAWTLPSFIGEIQGRWNELTVGPDETQHPENERDVPISLLHYTRGGPWHGVTDAMHERWSDELAGMLRGSNPLAHVEVRPMPHGVVVRAEYGQQRMEVIQGGEKVQAEG